MKNALLAFILISFLVSIFNACEPNTPITPSNNTSFEGKYIGTYNQYYHDSFGVLQDTTYHNVEITLSNPENGKYVVSGLGNYDIVWIDGQACHCSNNNNTVTCVDDICSYTGYTECKRIQILPDTDSISISRTSWGYPIDYFKGKKM